MREVPANAPTFDMCLPCCLGWVCVLIPEPEVVMDVVANCLDQRPSLLHVSELGPSELNETVRLAIPAAEQLYQRFNW